MLSKAARRLYERLLDMGQAEWQTGLVTGPDDPTLRELVDLDLVLIGPGYVAANPPRTARAEMMKAVGTRCRELLDEMLDLDEFLNGGRLRHDVGRHASVDVISDTSEVFLLSETLIRHAKRSLQSVNTLDRHRPGGLRYSGPSRDDPLQAEEYRIIYSAGFVTDPSMRRVIERAVDGGEDARIHPAPPLKFKIADGNAVLVPLDKTGAGGALLIKAPALCALFVDYFEKLWAESTPFDASRTNPRTLLNPLQTRILGLVADDTPDHTIARKLELSERTIRRHVGIILDKLGARTRAGAVVMALERGLLARRP
jgi:DNA-binding CsgD family transcriptional regulator